jgi:pimeloyl-ACP methyl ester carboxylesterase
VCPDLPGRGRSERLSDPERYVLGQYVSDMEHLLAVLELGDVAWIGTSLGGLIGMTLAPRPATRVRRLVLNDVGPFVPAAALRRIGEHLGTDPWFETLDQAESYLRQVRAGTGELTDDQWRRLTARTVRSAENDGYRLVYDPGIAIRYRRSAPGDVDVWDTWDSVTCPVLVLRGAHSDFLLPETAMEMTRRGPGARLIELDGCGHAPSLMDSSQIESIVDWLGPPT